MTKRHDLAQALADIHQVFDQSPGYGYIPALIEDLVRRSPTPEGSLVEKYRQKSREIRAALRTWEMNGRNNDAGFQKLWIAVHDMRELDTMSSPPEGSKPEGLAADLKASADRAYCDMIDQARRVECLGWEAKVKSGSFGKPEFDAHVKRGELYGKHLAFHEAIKMLSAALPSKPDAPKKCGRPACDGTCSECMYEAPKPDARVEALENVLRKADLLTAVLEGRVERGSEAYVRYFDLCKAIDVALSAPELKAAPSPERKP